MISQYDVQEMLREMKEELEMDLAEYQQRQMVRSDFFRRIKIKRDYAKEQAHEAVIREDRGI